MCLDFLSTFPIVLRHARYGTASEKTINKMIYRLFLESMGEDVIAAEETT